MDNYITKVGGIATALLALTITASAEIKLNDYISTNGYIVGTNQYQSQVIKDGYGIYKTDSFDVDAAKLLFDLNYKPLSGVISFYYQPATSVNLLDAYVTYEAGHGISISGGKFQSWLGFEAFDAINMYQISYANNDFLHATPNYHSGVRVEYSDSNYGAGVAILDSVYSPWYNDLKGDGELHNNQGYEAYFTYKGIKDVTLWSGIAYETRRLAEPTSLYSRYYDLPSAPSIVTLDFWASYQIENDTLVAAEVMHKNGDANGDRGYNWLFLINRTFTQKFSTALRISGEHVESIHVSNTWTLQQPNFTKFTVAPSYNLTANLVIRGEVSYYNYANNAYSDKQSLTSGRNEYLDHSTYIAVQAIFKF